MVNRLDSLIQTQKKLLNSVSHELRSPLARINLSLALLRTRSLEIPMTCFQRLDRDVERIDLLMGQLLTLSRLEAGFSSAEREDVDFAQLVEEVAADGNFEAQAWANPSAFRQPVRSFSGMPILMPLEALVKILFATQSASHGREAMSRSFWRSIESSGTAGISFCPGPWSRGSGRFSPSNISALLSNKRDAEATGGNGLGLAHCF